MSAASPLVIENLRGAFVGPVSLTVAPGACTLIAGPSGAGKSLFLRMIADLDPSEGEVRLGDLRRETVAAPTWRRQVIHVAAEAGWWAPRVDAHFVGDAVVPAMAAAEALGLGNDFFERPVATLSTGEKQRLALVRALARAPKVLLLDEPTSGLDPESVERVETLIQRQCASGLTLIVVTHDAAQAQRLGSARYTMTAGRLEPL